MNKIIRKLTNGACYLYEDALDYAYKKAYDSINKNLINEYLGKVMDTLRKKRYFQADYKRIFCSATKNKLYV